MNVHVTVNPRVCGGRPVITGTRIPVSVVLDHIAVGCSFDDIVRKFPALTREHVRAAVEFSSAMVDSVHDETLVSA